MLLCYNKEIIYECLPLEVWLYMYCRSVSHLLAVSVDKRNACAVTTGTPEIGTPNETLL